MKQKTKTRTGRGSPNLSISNNDITVFQEHILVSHLFIKIKLTSLEAQACNPISVEDEEGRPQVQDPPRLWSVLKVSLGKLERSCLKTN